MSWFDDILDKFDVGSALALGGSYLLNESGMSSAQVPQSGYQGSIPKYTAVRAQVQPPEGVDVTKRRPGSGGMRYFSDTAFVAPDKAETARTQAQEQAAGLAALNAVNPFQEGRPPPMVFPQREPRGRMSQRPASDVAKDLPAEASGEGLENFAPKYAKGGIAELAKGRYLNGDSDGMADEVRANIDGVQEARLSDGEYVIPADVVSHLGNGNSEAGAKVLDNFLAKVRKERTGNEKQGKEINPMKMLPS